MDEIKEDGVAPTRCVVVQDTSLNSGKNCLDGWVHFKQYKERWGIELFFKWVKQHLRIKQFLGRSENAVQIQVLTALISYLLVLLSHQENGGIRTL